MSGLVTPMPGWLSGQLRRYGAPLAMAMLGIAITLNDGCASDDEINGFYSELVEESDSVYAINEYYRALEAAYPFIEGFLGGVTSWTESPSLGHYDQVRDAAAVLATVRWSDTEEWCAGDILGGVYNEMSAAGMRRTQVFNYPTIEQMIVEGFFQVPLLRTNSFADMWCGSGTRVLGLAEAIRLVGKDPNQVEWTLNDPNQVAIALAALNMVGANLTAKVTLHCDREWSERWMALNGRDPYKISQVPREVLDEVRD